MNMTKVKIKVNGFYGVLTQHFNNPNIIYLPSYTSNIFSLNQAVFVTKYPDIDKNSILPLKVQFHEHPVVSVYFDKLKYMNADIDGDCVAVWSGDDNWEIDEIDSKPHMPINSLTFNEIKNRVKKIPESMIMDLLNCKSDFEQYKEDVHYRFNIIDKTPILSGTLFKRLSLNNYGLFFYDLQNNIRFGLNPKYKYKPSKAFLQSTKNYDIWIRTLQIICNKLNSICLKFKHPINSSDDLKKVLAFLKICNINIEYFERELGVSNDSRYTSIEEFDFWFSKEIEKDAFEIFKSSIKFKDD